MASLPYAIAAFTGAFLLFLVEPLIGKYLLPWFGGAPGVWATCLVFFQLAVLAGYAYAHALTRLRPRAQAVVHVLVLAAAAATLPLAPSAAWVGDGVGDPTWRVLALLAIELGLPSVALCASAPLMSAWLVRLRPQAPVWRLYALSNLGSFLALIAYPLLVEPAVGRAAQATGWSIGFVAYGVLAAVCALLAWRSPRADVEAAAAPPVGAARRAAWVGLPACATVVLMGGTSVLVQDVAAAPLLWVIPLGLYLLSFVVAFAGERWYRRGACLAALLPVLLLALLSASPEGLVRTLRLLGLGDAVGSLAGLVAQVVVHALAVFLATLICHGELYRLRPAAGGLTAFYLAIAAGGAIGGLFAALAAPLLFATYVEYRLGLLVACAAALVAMRGGTVTVTRWAIGLVAAGVVVAWLERIGLRAAAVDRGFFGAVAVRELAPGDPLRHAREMRHGVTRHGLQLMDEQRRRLPTAYYGEGSGVGRVLAAAGERPRRIGAVGLGVGTIACYARPGDLLRFYELDPAVDRLARAWFTYLADCPGEVEMVLGDGRTRLAAEPDQAFDVLVVDAFSSDAIPMHLLTVEAFALYRRHLAADGVLAVHITNQHLDLAPVVRAGARSIAWSCAQVADPGGGGEAWWLHESRWMLLTADRAALGPGLRRAFPPLDDAGPLNEWTDERASLLSALR